MARKPIIGRNFTGAATSTTTATDNNSPASDTVVGGIAGGIAAAAAASGPTVRTVEVSTLIPHPLNDPHRSEPGEGPKWDEIVQSIKSRGVESPAKAVTRGAFLKARPHYADSLPKGDYVLVFGHRRRAAALAAGVQTMPVIVEDTILKNNGDLDAMAVENLGREDLTPIAQAELFARYVDDLDLTQKDIAKRLGVDQATISRRLSLLLLTEESTAAVESGQLSPSAAATLGSGLPYGPVRKWQRSRREAEQTTPQRHEDQNTALSRILTKEGTVQKIVEFVLAERKAHTEAGERGITIVDDPTAALGGPAHEVADPTSVDGEIVGTIDSITGALLLWELVPAPAAPAVTPTPETAHHDAADEPAEDDTTPSEPADNDKPAKTPQKPSQSPTAPSTGPTEAQGGNDGGEAASARLEACEKAAASTPSKPHMAEILAQAIAHGIDTTSNRVVARADTWATGTGGAADNYAAAAAIAWRRVLAGYERSVETAGTTWGPVQQTYIELLANRAGYQPTALERRLMQRA